MIIKTTKELNNNWFDYTYSDLSVCISNDNGDIYIDAYDVLGSNIKYYETDISIYDDGEDEDEPEQ